MCAAMAMPPTLMSLASPISSCSPIHAAAVGLTLHGVKRQDCSAAFRLREDKILSKVKHRMSDWLSDFF